MKLPSFVYDIAIVFSTLILGITISLSTPVMYRKEMRKYVASHVVLLTSENVAFKPAQGGGTGFHVTAPSGAVFIMTNRHVCWVSKTGKMWANTDGKNQEVSIVKISDRADLCILSPMLDHGLTIGDEPESGDEISYLGHPRIQPNTFVHGEFVGNKMIEINGGIVDRTVPAFHCETKDARKTVLPEAYLSYTQEQYRKGIKLKDLPNYDPAKTITACVHVNIGMVTTMYMYAGASGSPVVNLFGQVVGVMYGLPSNGGWGWAVTLIDINHILNGR